MPHEVEFEALCIPWASRGNGNLGMDAVEAEGTMIQDRQELAPCSQIIDVTVMKPLMAVRPDAARLSDGNAMDQGMNGKRDKYCN